MFRFASIPQAGHTVTVYERNDKCGGLLRYGIPTMKLEKEVRTTHPTPPSRAFTSLLSLVSGRTPAGVRETLSTWHFHVTFLTDRFIDQLIDWLIAWVTDRVNLWLIDWSIDQLTAWESEWLTDWICGRSIDWLIDWSNQHVCVTIHRLYSVVSTSWRPRESRLSPTRRSARPWAPCSWWPTATPCYWPLDQPGPGICPYLVSEPHGARYKYRISSNISPGCLFLFFSFFFL